MPAVHAIIDDFLGPRQAARLLGFAIANEKRFAPSDVHLSAPARSHRAMRRSLSLAEGHDDALGEFHRALDARKESLRASLGVPGFTECEREVDFVAHRDGHHYRRHVDALSGTARVQTAADRMISLVYYLHREPRAFSGGELDLFAVPGGARHRVEPRHDRLVAFSSIVPHEVRPIALPGNAFADARFSVACWLCRARRQG